LTIAGVALLLALPASVDPIVVFGTTTSMLEPRRAPAKGRGVTIPTQMNP
jgi:hypothetical protein